MGRGERRAIGLFVKSQPCRNPLGPSCFDGKFYRRPPIKFYIISLVLAHIRLYRLLLEIGGHWMDRVCRLSKGGTIGRSAGLTVLARCSQRYVHFFTGTSKCTCLSTCSTGTHIRVTMRHRCRKSLLGPLVFSTHAVAHRSFSFLHFPNILPNRQPITPLRSGIITLK